MPPRRLQRPRAALIAALFALPLACNRDPIVENAMDVAARAENPLLAEWTGPYGGVPQWDAVRPELFPEAFEEALEERRAEIAAITGDPNPPTFENTLLALEKAGETLDRVDTYFGVMTSNRNSPEYQALDREWSPRLTAARDEILFDEALFARIDAVYQARTDAGLDAEQVRLVERVRDYYVRAGAQLSAEDQEKLGAINQQLSSLFTEFRNKVLADEDTWTVLGEGDLAGLPPSLVEASKAAAQERGIEGYAIVNTRSSVDPFLTFSDRRDLREAVWRKFKARGDNGDANDTNETIRAIVKLRAERAKLLGFESHAHWRMQDTMAGDPAAAEALMRKVWPAAVARVGEEVADMAEIAGHDIEPWDYLYYAEKVRKARYDFDQAQLKPYFELNNMIEGAFWTAGQLYGLQFREITGTVPVFHEDVRVWEVTDAEGAHVGLFYGDYFARAGKRSGAWASGYRGHETWNVPRTPITSNSNNFVKGAPGEPVLISLDDATTLFHEFGHALHALLSEVRYPTLAYTPRDYVEYPSQVNEYWVLTRPVLDKYARHYQTGEPLPQELVDKIDAAKTFNEGYTTVAYLSAALVDMAIHVRPDGEIDPDAFEREALEGLGMPDEIAMRHRLPHFNHLFGSDSYSAGYYSYLWSEVMVADTVEAFEEAGDPFDRATAEKLRKHILAPGNSSDRAEAYRQFRGRDPEVRALLASRGFPTE